VRSSAAAEENDEGMAYKIRIGAKTLSDALNSITVLGMLPTRISASGISCPISLPLTSFFSYVISFLLGKAHPKKIEING
jgi:hypothetical protein